MAAITGGSAGMALALYNGRQPVLVLTRDLHRADIITGSSLAAVDVVPTRYVRAISPSRIEQVLGASLRDDQVRGTILTFENLNLPSRCGGEVQNIDLSSGGESA
ncbi:SAF domain-containing protein [Amycolatopsis rhizosphaerae]|nr:SAF domain-containing protein [Amycolatopsis rhizosphaerae]